MQQRAARITWMTDRANAVVWRLPVPRRVRARLSTIAFRAPETTADRVVEILTSLTAASVPSSCMGGWGVDALLGEQTRKHRDLDLLVDGEDLETALAVLADLGYREGYRIESPIRFGQRVVVRDRALREVDVHPLLEGAPRPDTSSGTINGHTVHCLSAEEQETAHLGYRPRRRDRADLKRLRRLVQGAPSALVIAVEAAAPLVDQSARDAGMPPHVTVLYPFLPSSALTDHVLQALTDTFAARPAFDFALPSTGSFPGVVFLAPEPAAPFVALTEAIVARWPDHPPHGGAFAEIVPHLTIAYGADVAGDTLSSLPLTARASEVWLMTRQGRRWVRKARFPLATRAASV